MRMLLAIIAITLVTSCSSKQNLVESKEITIAAPAPPQKTIRDDVPSTVIQSALERLKSGQSINWKDRTTGTLGAITPTRTFKIQNGSYCRDYVILFSGANGGGYAMWNETACRGNSGTWQKLDKTSA